MAIDSISSIEGTAVGLARGLVVAQASAASSANPVQSLLSAVQQTSLGTAIRNSNWAVMALESVHLLGLALLGGGITLLALAAVRRGGLGGLAVAELSRGLRPILIAGLLIMAASGTLIAWSMPYKYYLNTAFRLKMLILLLAIAVTLWLWRTLSRRPSGWRPRWLALIAFGLWLGVGLCGRWIGFL